MTLSNRAPLLACLSTLLGLASTACVFDGPYYGPHDSAGDDWGDTTGGESGGDGDGDPTTGDGDGDPGGQTEIPAFPVPGTQYLLKTEGRGAAWCLDSNDPTYDWNQGNTVMDRCNGSLGKHWTFEPVLHDGLLSYRLSSEQHGGKCLQGNDPDTSVMNGAAFMAECQDDNPDQLWEFVEWGEWYLLRTRFQGSARCLDSNWLEGLKNGTAYMSECEASSAQLFQLTTPDHYSLELCEPLGVPTSALDGVFCTYPCSNDDECPQSTDGTAASCGLQDNEGQSFCGLFCNPQNDQCPAGATCQAFPGEASDGICLY